MVDYLKKAKKVSKYYPPLQLPTDGSEWMIGHTYLKDFAEERKKIYIPSMVSNIYQAWQDLIKSRDAMEPLKRKIFVNRLANCGELSDFASLFLRENNIGNYRVQLLFDYQNYESDTDHSFLLFRVDNKKMTYKELIADLYQQSVRVLDVWYGKCGYPREIFNDYVQFFQDQRYGKFFRFRKGTALVLKEDYEPNKYIIGRVVSDGVQVANRGSKLKFSAICIPHQYKKLRYRSCEKE